MSPPDIINGGFEGLSAVATTLNIRRILRDRAVAGVDWRVTGFFVLWGIWNLFYYPHLHQWFSLIGGVAIVTANLIWVVLALRFTNPSMMAALGAVHTGQLRDENRNPS